jgi:hypothetical protein
MPPVGNSLVLKTNLELMGVLPAGTSCGRTLSHVEYSASHRSASSIASDHCGAEARVHDSLPIGHRICRIHWLLFHSEPVGDRSGSLPMNILASSFRFMHHIAKTRLAKSESGRGPVSRDAGYARSPESGCVWYAPDAASESTRGAESESDRRGIESEFTSPSPTAEASSLSPPEVPSQSPTAEASSPSLPEVPSRSRTSEASSLSPPEMSSLPAASTPYPCPPIVIPR